MKRRQEICTRVTHTPEEECAKDCPGLNDAIDDMALYINSKLIDDVREQLKRNIFSRLWWALRIAWRGRF